MVSVAQIDDGFNTEEQIEGKREINEKVINPKIRTWNLFGYGAFLDSTKLDTLIDNFHIYNPVFLNSITSSYIGNYGAPSQNNNFFEKGLGLDFYFLNSRSAYMLTPEQIIYYNTRTPYTRLDFSQSENRSVKNETRFNVFHSQNVNPYLNFTLLINLGKSSGQYNSQESRNNFITLYSNYNNDNFSFYSGFISNLIGNNENGGIKFDSLIFNGQDSEFLNTNLTESKSLFNSTFFFANGEYRFGKTIEVNDDSTSFRPVFGILFDVNYQRNKQEFTEDENDDNTFFKNTYFADESYMKDSLRFNKLSNLVQLKQYENFNRKTSFGKRAFIGLDVVNLSMPGVISDINYRQEKKYSNLYAGGGIFRQTGKFWKWNFEGKIYFTGRNIGQTELEGQISKPFEFLNDSLASLTINGKINNIVTDIFQEEFYSNHFKWKNDFQMEQRMDAGAVIRLPSRKLYFGANYALINNFIFINEEAIPSQTNKQLLVVSAHIDKDFNYRNLHFRTRVLWQQASDESFIHLPDLSAFVSAYYKFVISKVMFSQIGADVRYNTMYYADAYSPATGLFYLQNKKKYGNYPFIDVYANLRLKRTTVFFKMINIGTQFLDGEYITVPHYPMPRSTFRLGVSWLFYD